MTAARRPDDGPAWSDAYVASEIARIEANDAAHEAEYQADRAAYYRAHPDGPIAPHPCHTRAGWYAQLAED